MTLDMAMLVFLRLQHRDVLVEQLDRQMVTNSPATLTYVINANDYAPINVTASNDNPRAWKPPGNYHHRRGHR